MAYNSFPPNSADFNIATPTHSGTFTLEDPSGNAFGDVGTWFETRVGNFAVGYFTLAWGSKGSASGQIRMVGLPRTNTSNPNVSLLVVRASGITGLTGDFCFLTYPNLDSNFGVFYDGLTGEVPLQDTGFASAGQLLGRYVRFDELFAS